MRNIIKDHIYQSLKRHIPERELHQLIRMYLEDKEWNKYTTLEELIPELNSDLDKLLGGMPIQYVTGKSYFYDRVFYVNEDVLIPRPETEELVARIIDKHKIQPGLKILDIGSGSGCIPIILKDKLLDPEVYAIDISRKAVYIAQLNAKKYAVKINFLVFDFLDEVQWNQLPLLDIIVSNPPYIRPEEKSMMTSSVLNYEPLSALIPESDDPLIFYRKIAQFGKLRLLKEGKIYVEINEFLSMETLTIFSKAGFEANLIQDMQGKDRIICASLKV